MKSRIVNLEVLCKNLKPFLPQYLEEHGIDTTKNFKCLNPKHDDSNPSMTCKQIPEQAFCFSCGFSCDIFTAASILEGKPDKGKEWMEENVFYLAKKYNVPIPEAELTPEEVYEYRTYQAYKLAAELVSDKNFGDYTLADQEIQRRGWDKDKCANWGIGTVNYSEFRNRLKAAGYDARFLDGIDLGRSNLFDNYNLIFTVHDDEGRPVGFSARRLDDKGPKYTNTATTGLECAIFKKGERLYGFDIAKDAQSPLYIFEGQANVVTLRHHGHMNCCCTMGTAFTDHHIALLKKHGIFNLVFIYDSDGPGEAALINILDNRFKNEKDFRIKIATPPHGKDPDDFVRENGYAAFGRLIKKTAFAWRIERSLSNLGEDPTEEELSELSNTLIPLIISEPSHIDQERMAKEVSRMTGIGLSTILSEIKRRRDEKIYDIQKKKKAVIESLLYDVNKNPEDIELALTEGLKSIRDIDKDTNGPQEVTSTLNFINTMKEVDEARSGEFEGFYLNPLRLGPLQFILNGNWRENKLFYIGGSSQSSKTSLASQLAYEIASDPRNNAMCIYHSIDDAKDTIIKKWICHGVDGFGLFQNAVSNPNYWEKEVPGVSQLRNVGYSSLIKLANDNRLVIKDNSDGGSFIYIETIVKFYRELYPDRHIVLFVDNFHKLPDLGELTGQERTKRLSNYLKRSAITHKITIIATAEYRKLQPGEKPSNLALAECLEENTLIRSLSDGKQVKIKDVYPGMIVDTIDENTLKKSHQKVVNKVYKGNQDCYRVLLNNGMEITGTENHPLYNDFKGWTKIKDLKVGDALATPSKIDIISSCCSITEDEARFLGYMAGDGNYGSEKHQTTPRFTNNDLDIINDISRIATTEFKDIKITSNNHFKSKELKFSRSTKSGTNSIKERFLELGIWNQLADKKTIPEDIFRSTDKCKANYISGLIATDGSINKNKNFIRFFNTSKDLVYGLQTLLLDLGIISTITISKQTTKDYYKDIYCLLVSTSSINIFKDKIKLYGYKQNLLNKLKEKKTHTKRLDNLPLAYSYRLNKFLTNSKLPVRIKRKNKLEYVLYKNKTITRETFNLIKENLVNIPSEINKLSSKHIIWSNIKSIEYVGKKEVYDLEIENTHNFLANNIFCHNSRSLEYDADVIIHMHNDMHYNGPASLVVHKDENGQILPRIWSHVGKNKISGETPVNYYNLFPGPARLIYCDRGTAEKEYAERKIELSESFNPNLFNGG